MTELVKSSRYARGRSELTANRLAGAGAALACAALLGTAAWLSPSGAGHGTHTQLGMPPCGWVLAFDKPCPTCGMTTSFAHAAHGELWAAFVTQPFGALLALASAMVFWMGLHSAVTGSRALSSLGRLFLPRYVWIGVALLVAAWVYKLLVWVPGSLEGAGFVVP
ncbi:MAG: DUF2752 domain-containing protein [Phycisphaerales bacterium]|nr:DUF2752 domain-containing protein [Phycisphaerales bacterium]